MASRRLVAFTGFLLAVAALIGACSDDTTTLFDPNGVGGLGGFGGVGPFTGMGGFAALGGEAGAAAPDAGDATVARDDLFEVGAIAPTTIPAPGLLANDTLAGAALPAGSISTRLGGSVELHQDGSFIYTPPADPGALPRLDNFSYALQAEGGEFSANVGLGLVAPPVASDDELGVLPDDTLFLDPPGVLENDQPYGATISAFDATSSQGGLVVLTQDGGLTYSPPAGFAGEDSFSYTLSNLTGSATALVHISVDETPAAAEDHFVGSKGEVLSPAGSLLDNDARGAPQASIVSFGGGSLGGSVADHAAGTSAAAGDSLLTVTANGAVTFIPDSSLVGPFEFFYRLQNSAGVSEARVVLDLHERALAQDDTFDVAAGSTHHVAADAQDALLANDVGTPAPVITSFGGGSLGGTVADHAVGNEVEFSGGRLTVHADGSFTFVAGLDASGELSFDYQIENAAGQDEGTVHLIVSHAPEITSAETLVLHAGSDQNLPFQLTATGSPAPVITLDGELPEGVTFANDSLTGSADVDSAGTYDVTVTASNGVAPDAVQSLTITVQTEALITGAPSTTFTVGVAGSYTPIVVGVPTPILTLDGDLPPGLAFDGETGVISGTPTPGAGGVYSISITADSALPGDSILLVSIEVLEAPAITSAASHTFVVGQSSPFPLTATGRPQPSVSVSGTLPAGIGLLDGALTGVPSAGSGGTYHVTVGASNGVSPNASQSLELTVNEAPSLSGAAQAHFTVGGAGSYVLSSSGFPAPTLSVTGSLPSGLSFDAQTGILSGTPGAGTGGTHSLTFGADNGVGSDASLPVSLIIDEGSLITSASSTTFTVGTAGTFTVTSAGTPAPTLSLTGSLPAGLSFTPATGVLAGTPAPGTGGLYGVTFGASNGVGTDSSQSFALTVLEAPAVTGASSATFRVGTAGLYAPVVTGFPAPVLSVTGTVPDGLGFDPLTGALSGTPEPGSGGTYEVSIGTLGVALPLTLQVEEASEITSDDQTTFRVGTAGSFTVTAAGFPAPGFELDEELPPGLTFSLETGVLEGTPAPGTGGQYTLTFSADNDIGDVAIQTFTLTIEEAAGLSGAASTTFVVGTPSSYGVLRTGFPSPTLSLTGSLPGGLGFDASAGTISGTAQTGSGGDYSVSIHAANGIGSGADLALTVHVRQAPAITSASSTTFTVGTAGSFNVTATGTPAPTFSATGSLPSGVTLGAAGLLSGTPAGGSGGTYPVTIQASNGVGSAASQSFTLTVNQASGISGASSKTFTVGVASSYTPTATGFPAPSLSLTGSLPSGLSFSTSTGVISGTALSGSGGTYPVTINADNGVGVVAALPVSITVQEPTSISSANSTIFTVGSAGSFTVTATGTPAPTLGLTGSLPTGVTFNSTTGSLSGTPASGMGGSYSLTFSANNGVGSPASQSFTLTVREAPSISGTPPSPADAGTAYSHTFTFGGFPAPTFSVFSGSLPTGLTLNSSTGVISGTPSAAGTFSNITVRAQNVAGNADITFTIVVNLAVPPPSATGESFAVTGNIPIDVTSSVLSNDTLNGASITGFGVSLASAATTSPGATLTTTGGGSVTLASDGTFSYDPPAGTTGSDSFAYTIANAGGSSAAQVSLTISNRVWFVNSSAASGGNGKATSPFTDLPSVGAGSSGDAIYVFRGTGTYSAKTLSSGQRLIGQGVTVNSTHLGFTLAPFARSTVFGTAGANSVMRTLTLANSSYVRGMDVSAVAGQRGLVGASTSSLDISGMAVTASSAAAVDLSSTGGTVSLTSVTGTGGTNAIAISSNTGSFTVTGDGTGVRNGSGGTLSSTSGDAVLLSNAQNITLRAMNLTSISASAVRGIIVNNFTAQSLTFNSIGTGLDFDENVTGNANLTGVVSVTNSSFDTATSKFVSLLNFSGTISSFTFDNNTFANNSSNATDFLVWDSAAITSMSIKNNTFTNTGNTLSANAIQVYLGRVATATSTPFVRVDLDGNVITGTNGTGIRLRVQDCNGTLQTKVTNNSVSNMTSSGFTQGIRVESGTSTGDSTVCAQITGNSSVFSNGGLTGVTNGGIGLRRQSASGGLNDTFGIVGLPAGSSTCPVSGTTTCAATPAVESYVSGLNPSGNGTLLISATSGFSSCTLP